MLISVTEQKHGDAVMAAKGSASLPFLQLAFSRNRVQF